MTQLVQPSNSTFEATFNSGSEDKSKIVTPYTPSETYAKFLSELFIIASPPWVLNVPLNTSFCLLTISKANTPYLRIAPIKYFESFFYIYELYYIYIFFKNIYLL